MSVTGGNTKHGPLLSTTPEHDSEGGAVLKTPLDLHKDFIQLLRSSSRFSCFQEIQRAKYERHALEAHTIGLTKLKIRVVVSAWSMVAEHSAEDIRRKRSVVAQGQ